MLKALKERAQTALSRVVRLPVLSEAVLDDPRLERQAALAGLVPKRCGLCKNFEPQDMADTAKMNGAWAQASALLSPQIMGALKGVSPTPVGSDAARELRPHLSDSWEDYGGCRKHPGLGVWGFAEQPEIPGDFAGGGSKCEAWR